MAINPLKRIASFLILAALVGAFFLSVPKTVLAGIPQFGSTQGPTTDQADFVQVGYWDLRDRETFFQVTNVSGAPITVHVQTFNASNPDPIFALVCTEFDFTDTYTGFDTHVYNVRNLTRNNGQPLNAPILDDGHGYIAVTVTSPGSGCQFENQVLIANQRIIDIPGNYEYRANALGTDNDDGADKEVFGFNFNDVGNASFSDVVVMYMDIEFGDDPCRVEPNDHETEFQLVDLGENILSCPEFEIGCDDDFDNTDPALVNLGINQAIPNSRGVSSVCSGTDPSGWMIVAEEDDCDESDEFCGGWIGLNNGDGTGSMDSWVALSGDLEDYFD